MSSQCRISIQTVILWETLWGAETLLQTLNRTGTGCTLDTVNTDRRQRKKRKVIQSQYTVNETNGCLSLYTRVSSISVENHSGYYCCVHKHKGAIDITDEISCFSGLKKRINRHKNLGNSRSAHVLRSLLCTQTYLMKNAMRCRWKVMWIIIGLVFFFLFHILLTVFVCSFFLFFLLCSSKEFNPIFLAENKLKKNQQCLSDITFTPLSPMIYQYTKCAKCYFLMGCQIKSYSSAADRHYQCKDSGGGVTCSSRLLSRWTDKGR